MSTERSARLARYGLWQLRDYLVDKGIGTAIVMLFVLATAYVPLRAGLEIPGLERLRPVILQLFEEFISWLVLLGALFATNGIVSDDRKHGYYRFLFAKPVNVPRFYAQKLLVHAIGFVLLSVALLLLFNMLVGRPNLHCGAVEGIARWRCVSAYVSGYLDPAAFPFFGASLLATLALLFLALAGVGFFVSAAWRVDWLSFMTVYIVSRVLWGFLETDRGWAGMAVRVLPPVHKLPMIYAALVQGAPLPMDALRWLVLYGLACFVLGIVIIRRRPLTTS